MNEEQPGDLSAYFDRIDYPYYVVTVRSNDARMSGCLAGFVTQSSIAPPNFLVCISKANHTFGVAEQSAGVGLHLLGSHQVDLARLFGEETGDEVDKFAACDWRPCSSTLPSASRVTSSATSPRAITRPSSCAACEPWPVSTRAC